VNKLSAENVNLGFDTTFLITLETSLLLVKLQRPFPVMKSFLPILSFFSNKTTFAPKLFAVIDAISPAGPPPITAIFFILKFAFNNIKNRVIGFINTYW
jgi:hypothetical protein